MQDKIARDREKILAAARSVFGIVVNAMARPTVNFPMMEEELAAVEAAYGGLLPSYITIQRTGSRTYWRGQIWKASEPM